MAKNDNIQDLLIDVANAIRAKKGSSAAINPQDFSSEITSIAGSSGTQRVTYLRRNGAGYINTGINGANSNLKIVVRYALRAFPTGYWSLIHAYHNESSNATRILMNKNTTILGALNSIASSSASMSRTGYTGIIYTDVLEPSGTSFKLSSNGTSTTKARSNGTALTNELTIFPKTEDAVDIELYELKIYNSSTLVRNYLPCIQNGEYGLWDTVTETFYGNEGTGAFEGETIIIN